MRFRRRRKQPAQVPGPVPAERESAAALRASLARLDAAREQVIVPHRRLRDQNNVTEVVRRLISEGRGDPHGRSAAPG